jgi:hypothetical protein
LAERWRAGKARGGERRGGEYLWRLIFPPRCLTCAVLLPAGAEAPLCRSCLSSFIPAGPLCPRCGELLPPAAPCSCIPESAPLRGLFALSWYEGAWRQMLHRFKFRGKAVSGPASGELAGPVDPGGDLLGARFRYPRAAAPQKAAGARLRPGSTAGPFCRYGAGCSPAPPACPDQAHSGTELSFPPPASGECARRIRLPESGAAGEKSAAGG